MDRVAKTGTRFVCQMCGATSPKWGGKCQDCGEWNSLVEEAIRAAPTSLAQQISRNARVPLPAQAGYGDGRDDPAEFGGNGQGRTTPAAPVFSYMGAANSGPRRITEIVAIDRERTTTGIGEFDRVLGGGVVPGSLILIGGDPGVGKSTLLTGVAGNLAREHGTVLYVSGEESVEQIKLRASRLGAEHEDLLLASETDVAQVAVYAQQLKPKYLIIDSIQTMQSPDVDSPHPEPCHRFARHLVRLLRQLQRV